MLIFAQVKKFLINSLSLVLLWMSLSEIVTTSIVIIVTIPTTKTSDRANDV